MAINGRPRRKNLASSTPSLRPDHPLFTRGWTMGATRTRESSPRMNPSTSSLPPLDSPEFDRIAKEWLENLIRQAKTNEPSPPSPGRPVHIANMYDLRADPLRLMAGLVEVSRDALEDAIRDAGFDGLIAPAATDEPGGRVAYALWSSMIELPPSATISWPVT